jgi:hypothetical protein
MTTISIKEDTRKELLRIAGEIQKRTHERVDFDTLYSDLMMERHLDERGRRRSDCA